VKNPKLINSSIDRFDFLLNDERSPLISNFLYLLDYSDGRDMPSFKEFAKGQKENKYDHLMDKYLR